MKRLGMKKGMNLNTKMILLILSASALIYIAAIGYISIKARQMAYDNAQEIANTYASNYAAQIRTILEKDLIYVKSLAQAFSKYHTLSDMERQQLAKEMYTQIFIKNPQFYGVWDSWEFAATDPSWSLPYGRTVHEVWRDNGRVMFNVTTKSLDGDPIQYARIKKLKKDALEVPYFYSYTGKENDRILMTSLIAPIMDNENYVGVVGVDIQLARFQTIIDKIHPFEEGYAYLLASNGCFVAHQNPKLTGDTISKVMPEYTIEYKIRERMHEGKAFSFEEVDRFGEKNYTSLVPIYVGNCPTPWYMGIVVPKSIIMKEANRDFIFSVVVGVVGLILLTFIIFYIAKSISTPIKNTTQVLRKLAEGDISESNRIEINSKDEIGRMADSVNNLIDGLNTTADFANEIGQGNLNRKHELLGDNDVLGQSLLSMRESLLKAKEAEDKRKQLEEKENWATQGLAKFADILRQNNDNMEKLAYNVIKNLVGYLNANQGGIFILNQENEQDKYLELISSYAYERKKYLQKRIEIGDGLVGTCFVEQESIYLEKIPKDYVNITSGLGDANPNTLLLVPLKFNDEVFGVVEMASFKTFEPHQIEFVENVGESIASTISTVKINVRTAELLQQSQQQSEEMRAQEEEMRQNMEELQATQEQLAEKEKEQTKEIDELRKVNEKLSEKETQFIKEHDELDQKINELEAIREDYQKLKSENNSYKDILNEEMGFVQYDFNGKISKVNERYCKLLGYSRNELLGKKIYTISHKKQIVEDISTKEFWEGAKYGQIYQGKIKRYTKDKQEIVGESIINTIFDKENRPYRIMEFFKK